MQTISDSRCGSLGSAIYEETRWTGDEQARIVAESFEEGANISEVARRNGVARGLLTVWRHQVAAAVAGKPPSFADPNWCGGWWWDSWRVRADFVGTDEAVGDRCTGRQALRGNPDRDEWRAHSGRPGVDLVTLATALRSIR
ncbi:transposase [Bradyrhizobium sp. 164]|uniref:transposase n=1 Tax=Bradyrhizobium sp. 164 TaxID=2782637 RepID=UPI003208D630